MAGEAGGAYNARGKEAPSRLEGDLGEAVAVAEYRVRQGKILVSHTEVRKARDGKGSGSALIEAGLTAAREPGLKVISTWPLVASHMKRHPDNHDLLDGHYHSVLGAE